MHQRITGEFLGHGFNPTAINELDERGIPHDMPAASQSHVPTAVSSVVVTLTTIHAGRGITRLRAAVPNTAGLKGSTSFRPPYLVAESSDCPSPGDEERFYAKLRSMGFSI